MLGTINAAKPMESTNTPTHIDCAVEAKSNEVKYWTFLPNDDQPDNSHCHLFNELIPKPSDDKSLTGSQACNEFYQQYQQTPLTPSGSGPGPFVTVTLDNGRKKRNTNSLAPEIIPNQAANTNPATDPNQATNSNQARDPNQATKSNQATNPTDIPTTTEIPTTVPNQSSNPNQSVPTVPKLAEPPNVDVYLNPLRKTEKAIVEEFMTNITRALFNPPLPETSYPHLFRLLRHTNLPCMPLAENKTQLILRCPPTLFSECCFNQVPLGWAKGGLC